MMAILERKFSEAVDDDLVALVDKERIVLARQWFVVARKKVVASWIAAPPSFSKNVRFLAFEDVVDVFGGKSAFNALVREMLDFDFYREWVENESPAGP